MSKQNFSVVFGGSTLAGDVMPSQSRPSLLFLHGAGKSKRSRFDALRNLLAQADITSCAFDFVGHGETGGELPDSNLEDRTKQALKVIKGRQLAEPLSIFGASMSGYTAVKLTQQCRVKNLIFLVPAMYAAEAYTIPFGAQFSELIRKPHSWLKSDAWNILKNFKGNVLIFAAENDQVIPRDVIQKIYASAEQAKSREIVTIKDAPHLIVRYLDEHPAEMQVVLEHMKKIIGN